MNKEIAIKVLKAYIEFSHISHSNNYVTKNLEEMLLNIDKSIKKDFLISNEIEEFLDIDKIINTTLITLGIDLKIDD